MIKQPCSHNGITKIIDIEERFYGPKKVIRDILNTIQIQINRK